MIILALIIITYLFVYNIILVRELIKTSGTLGKGNSPTDVLNKASDIKLPEEYLSNQKNDTDKLRKEINERENKRSIK